MTLANTPIVNSYVGNNSANAFAFNFPVFESADLAVVVTSPTGTIYTLIFGTDFTVSGLPPSGGPPSTGSITLVNSGQPWLTSGNLSTSWSLSITSNLSFQQETSLRNQGDFYPEDIESSLDYLTRLCQQLLQAIQAPVIPQSLTVVTGDINITTGGSGLVVTDQATGKTYRILVYQGVLSSQEVT